MYYPTGHPCGKTFSSSSPTTFWKYLCPHEAVRFFSPLNAMNDVDDEESDEESGVE
jgi:hypothetical protein